MEQDRFIRIKEVMKLTGIARSTVWLWAKEGKLPKPIKLSPRLTVWSELEIQAWLNEKYHNRL